MLWKKPDSKGHSLVEMMGVMALLSLIGVAVYVLVVAGGWTYIESAGRTAEAANKRTAMAYLLTKIRQNDAAGALRLVKAGDGDAIAIEETIDGAAYENWIYQDDGKLKEVLLEKGSAFDPASGFTVVESGGITVEKIEDGALEGLRITVRGKDGDAPLSCFVGRRCFE